MTPQELSREHFRRYPPKARLLATSRIELLRQLAPLFLPLLLREMISYDWEFPVERRELEDQLAYLSSLSREQLAKCMAPFRQLRLSPQLERFDWVNSPAQFSEQLTAHLWATHQIDAFRAASIEYVHAWNAVRRPEPLPIPRLGIAIIGAGVAGTPFPVFRKLRRYGIHFRNVNDEGGRETLLRAVIERVITHPVSFGHWYIDGADPGSMRQPGLTCMSYAALEPVRSALITRMRNVMQPGGGGPEVLRTMLAEMRPEELGLSGESDEGVLNRFQVSVLTEGAGTQLFSTTFVQWSAREVLRRAQPLTLLTRFAPRQREQSMRELLAGGRQAPVPDPEGSLMDADMGAYYTWINQQRLSGADAGRFLVWFENHREVMAIGPSIPAGTEEAKPVDLAQVLSRVSSA